MSTETDIYHALSDIRRLLVAYFKHHGIALPPLSLDEAEEVEGEEVEG